MVGIVGELPYVLRSHSFDSLRLSCSSIVCSIGVCDNTMRYFIDPLWEILFLPYLPTGGDGVSYSRTHHGVNNSRHESLKLWLSD